MKVGHIMTVPWDAKFTHAWHKEATTPRYLWFKAFAAVQNAFLVSANIISDGKSHQKPWRTAGKKSVVAWSSLHSGSATTNPTTVPKVGQVLLHSCLPLPFSLACLFCTSSLKHPNWPCITTVSLHVWQCLWHSQQWCWILKPPTLEQDLAILLSYRDQLIPMHLCQPWLNLIQGDASNQKCAPNQALAH